MNDLVSFAEEVATRAHEGVFRRGSNLPYITHPAAVVALLEGSPDHCLAAAWLHDVAEDTLVTLNSLAAMFPPDVWNLVCLLTKEPKVSYLDYIVAISRNRDATAIKIADLQHNLSDLAAGTLRDKYSLALHILQNDNQPKAVNS